MSTGPGLAAFALFLVFAVGRALALDLAAAGLDLFLPAAVGFRLALHLAPAVLELGRVLVALLLLLEERAPVLALVGPFALVVALILHLSGSHDRRREGQDRGEDDTSHGRPPSFGARLPISE